MKDTTTLKGMNFYSVSKKTLLKPEFGRGLEKIYNLTEIKNKITDTLNNKGRVYYCSKYDKTSKTKDTLIIFVFKKTGNNKEKNTTFTLDKIYTNPEYDNVIYKNYMVNNCISIFEDSLIFEDTQKVILGDTVLEKNYFKAGSYAISGLAMGLGIGVLFGIIFHNLAIGIVLSICFASLYAVTMTSAGGTDNAKKINSGIDADTLFEKLNVTPITIEKAKENNLNIID